MDQDIFRSELVAVLEDISSAKKKQNWVNARKLHQFRFRFPIFRGKNYLTFIIDVLNSKGNAC